MRDLALCSTCSLRQCRYTLLHLQREGEEGGREGERSSYREEALHFHGPPFPLCIPPHSYSFPPLPFLCGQNDEPVALWRVDTCGDFGVSFPSPGSWNLFLSSAPSHLLTSTFYTAHRPLSNLVDHLILSCGEIARLGVARLGSVVIPGPSFASVTGGADLELSFHD